MSLGAPTVTSFGVSNTSLFTLNCTSTGSPPTTVSWTKDGAVLQDYTTYQTLRDGETSTYDTFLTIDTTLNELIGRYTCNVRNSAGQSNVESVSIQGKEQ